MRFEDSEALLIQQNNQAQLRRWKFSGNVDADLARLDQMLPARASAADSEVLALDPRGDLRRRDRKMIQRQARQGSLDQFEHKAGVVQKIDEDSGQLAQSLKDAVPIIVTTLQKFPFVTDKVGDLPERRYAVIIDEAHSSQSGEAAAELRGVLASAEIRERAKEEAKEKGLPDYEEEILKAMNGSERCDLERYGWAMSLGY